MQLLLPAAPCLAAPCLQLLAWQLLACSSSCLAAPSRGLRKCALSSVVLPVHVRDLAVMPQVCWARSPRLSWSPRTAFLIAALLDSPGEGVEKSSNSAFHFDETLGFRRLWRLFPSLLLSSRLLSLLASSLTNSTVAPKAPPFLRRRRGSPAKASPEKPLIRREFGRKFVTRRANSVTTRYRSHTKQTRRRLVSRCRPAPRLLATRH